MLCLCLYMIKSYIPRLFLIFAWCVHHHLCLNKLNARSYDGDVRFATPSYDLKIAPTRQRYCKSYGTSDWSSRNALTQKTILPPSSPSSPTLWLSVQIWFISWLIRRGLGLYRKKRIQISDISNDNAKQKKIRTTYVY